MVGAVFESSGALFTGKIGGWCFMAGGSDVLVREREAESRRRK